ncbi:hypothetical protein ABWED_2977 [Acinetobacter lwoffii]|nr:hypothetical protein ABEDC_3062 [Acinetobacter lwoffii]UVB02209.1 hypothetical protein ABWED_2977 [Acinetobacter lwoffii]
MKLLAHKPKHFLSCFILFSVFKICRSFKQPDLCYSAAWFNLNCEGFSA